MTQSSLSSLFAAKSVAIVGVSSDFHKVGHIVAKNMRSQGFIGRLSFINPKGGEILGKSVLKSVKDLKEPVDVIVFATPAETTLGLLTTASQYTQNFVILAAGFKEDESAQGKKRESELHHFLARHPKIRVLGPNCAGYINTHAGINATFLGGPIPVGDVGFISQSGALASVLIDNFQSVQSLGFSTVVSLGNKTNVDESEVLGYLAHDNQTRVIGLYLEDIKDGARFREVLHIASRKKPVIIIKAGTSAKGAQAAISHTGSMAGDDAVFDAVVKQTGAVRAGNLEEFICLLTLCSFGKIPLSRDLIVVTNAGGCGVLSADKIEALQMGLARLHVQVANNKRVQVHNPYDVRGDADANTFERAIAETGDEQGVGGVVVIVTPQANTQLEETAKAIVGHAVSLPHPVYPVFLGESARASVRKIFLSNRLPSFDGIDVLLDSLRKLIDAKYARENFANEIPHTSAMHRKSNGSSRAIDFHHAYQLLAHAGIPMLPYQTITKENEQKVEFDSRIFPVVAKAICTHETHKTDSGSIVTNIATTSILRETVSYFLHSRHAHSVAVQAQITGYELIFGVRRDPCFGVVLLVGLGGVLTNLLHEVERFVWPVTYEYFASHIASSKVGKVLLGYRGARSVPCGNVYAILSVMVNLMERDPTIQEIEINPFMLTRDGQLIGVDARVVVEG
jgi:acetyltransferase